MANWMENVANWGAANFVRHRHDNTNIITIKSVANLGLPTVCCIAKFTSKIQKFTHILAMLKTVAKYSHKKFWLQFTKRI